MRGPIDYSIVGFQGNKFDGSILQALGDAIDKGVIRLIALALITKDKKGDVGVLDVTNLDDTYAIEFAQKYQPKSDDIDKDDIDEMTDLLQNDTSAGLLVVEQLWAKPIKKALLDANGVLIADGRIHPDAAEEFEDDKGGK